MRLVRSAVIMGIMASGLISQSVYASGNVLLPDDTSSDSTTSPSLSLTPLTSVPPPDTNTSVEPAPAAPAAPAANYTPMPSQDTQTDTPAAQNGDTTPFGQTQVIQLPDPSATIDPALRRILSLTMNFEVLPNYKWGSTDLYVVNHAIGLAADQIPLRCHIGANGVLQTDAPPTNPFVGPPFAFDTGIRPQVQFLFAGNPNGLILRVVAVCDPVILPPNVGTVIESASRYMITLGQISCPTPDPSTHTILLNYTGNATGQCIYRE